MEYTNTEIQKRVEKDKKKEQRSIGTNRKQIATQLYQ